LRSTAQPISPPATIAPIWPGAVGAQITRHSPHGLGDDRHGDDLQTMQPGRMREIADLGYSVPEKDHRQGRRRREAQPSGNSPRQAGAQDAKTDPDLAARWSGQELAKGDNVGKSRFVEPAAPLDELSAEVTEMRDWSAK
jgi:hypothetical protein